MNSPPTIGEAGEPYARGTSSATLWADNVHGGPEGLFPLSQMACAYLEVIAEDLGGQGPRAENTDGGLLTNSISDSRCPKATRRITSLNVARAARLTVA